jgi:predicted acyl esterase
MDFQLLTRSFSSGFVRFETEPMSEETEVTGHPTVRLSMSLSARDDSKPSDLDVFVTLRHIDSNGEEGEQILLPINHTGCSDSDII